MRYTSHVFAFVTMVGGPFPGFVGGQGSYPIEIEIEPPAAAAATARDPVPARARAAGADRRRGAAERARRRRLLGWFAALVTARMPEGMRDLGAMAIRYNAQAYGYLLLVTARYPNASPALHRPSGSDLRSDPPFPEPPALTRRLAILAPLALVWAVASWLCFGPPCPAPGAPARERRCRLRAAVRRAVESYERFIYVSFFLSQVVLLVTLGLYARYGARFTRESAAGRIGTGMLLGMLGFGFVWLSQLGFGLAELWWQRRHDHGDGLPRMGRVELGRARRRVPRSAWPS